MSFVTELTVSYTADVVEVKIFVISKFEPIVEKVSPPVTVAELICNEETWKFVKEDT